MVTSGIGAPPIGVAAWHDWQFLANTALTSQGIALVAAVIAGCALFGLALAAVDVTAVAGLAAPPAAVLVGAAVAPVVPIAL